MVQRFTLDIVSCCQLLVRPGIQPALIKKCVDIFNFDVRQRCTCTSECGNQAPQAVKDNCVDCVFLYHNVSDALTAPSYRHERKSVPPQVVATWRGEYDAK